MKNYKTKVNSEAESKEVQEFFESLGYKKGMCSLGNYPAVIVTTQDWATGNYCSTRALGLNVPAHDNYTEITLPELRDMVVLKRNDVNDATHQDKDDAELKYRLINNQWHVITDSSQVWRKSSVTLEESPLFVKPIEKTMREYLIPNRNYEYILTDAREGLEPHAEDWVEIPEGAEVATASGLAVYFWKPSGNKTFVDNVGWSECDGKSICTLGSYLEDSDVSTIWQRLTQPEALPFIDDEPKYTDDEVKYMDDNGQGRLQLINNQYAEIEQVRQHSHYKKDVSNLEFVDVYRVLKLFDVTDPCLQHAIKKLLCSGQRGAKSSDQDVQEAIDSLVRFQQMRIEDSLD